MPDQSLQNDPTAAAQESRNPAEVAGNTPSEAKPSALAANVTEASEGEKQQADVTINQDPQIRQQDADGTTSSESYEDMNLEELREELRRRDLSRSGNKPELIARLKEHDGTSGDSSASLGAETSDAEPSEPSPTAEVNPTNVENGGIQRTEVGQKHAEMLQGLSAERRQQQLEAAQSAQQA